MAFAGVLGSATVRLTVLYALVFSLSVLILGVLSFQGIRLSLRDQLRDHVTYGAAQLFHDYEDDGLDELRHDIEERIEADPVHRLRYSLRAPDGTVAFDPLTDFPEPGWHTVAEPEALLVYSVELDDGYRLAVAAELADVHRVERALRNAFAITFVLTLALSAAGGFLTSRRFLAQVERLKATADSVGAGELSARIPLRGSGDEFDRLATVINRMLGRIETLVMDVKQVSSNIAHDLRTPLGRVRGRLESLAARADDVDTRVELDACIRQVDETLEAFSGLLRIAEIESGSRRAAFAPVALSEIAGHVIDAYEPAAEEGGRDLVGDLEPDVRVLGDRALLTQLMANLIANALQHTPAGTRVRVRVSASAAGPGLEVGDDGPGVPASERDKVFHPFFRSEHSANTFGTGLGLSLVAAIARLHEAVVTLHDNEPGLRVRVSFPTRA